MSEIENLIQDALFKNVDLSEQEYREETIKADEITKGHGLTKKAPVSESIRHKRVQVNFYATALNFMASLLGEITTLTQQNAYLLSQNAELIKAIKGDTNDRHTTEQCRD